MDVVGVDRVIHPSQILETIREVDALIVTLPGTLETTGLINHQIFAAARTGLTVVNVGRGSVIDEASLINALHTGQVGFAALDVFAVEPLPENSPLWESPNVVISPHTAALSRLEESRIADLFTTNATRYFDGKPLLNEMSTTEFY